MIAGIMDWFVGHIILLVLGFFIGFLVLYDLYHKLTDRELEDTKDLQQDHKNRDFTDIRGEAQGKIVKEKGTFAKYDSWT